MGHDLYSRQACKSPAHSCSPDDLADGLAFIGHSAAIERLRLQVRRVAPHLRVALITGERGTGKQQVARALHNLSGKDSAAFQVMEMAREAMADQLHTPRLSHNGNHFSNAGSKRRPTYYMPHLSSLSPRHQAELLAAIHSLEAALPATRRPQLIFASTDDLRGLVAAGQFHPELYRTISSVEINLPPLRSRPEDIAEIAASLLGRPPRAHHHAVSPPHSLLDGRALSRLKGYRWPGNLRELAQVVALASRHARSGTIEAMHLPPLEAFSTARTLQPAAEPETERLDEVIERHVLGVLVRCAGNKVRAAERLGISRSTLYRMLEASPSAATLHHPRPCTNDRSRAIATASPTLHH